MNHSTIQKLVTAAIFAGVIAAVFNPTQREKSSSEIIDLEASAIATVANGPTTVSR